MATFDNNQQALPGHRPWCMGATKRGGGTVFVLGRLLWFGASAVKRSGKTVCVPPCPRTRRRVFFAAIRLSCLSTMTRKNMSSGPPCVIFENPAPRKLGLPKRKHLWFRCFRRAALQLCPSVASRSRRTLKKVASCRLFSLMIQLFSKTVSSSFRHDSRL